MIRKPILCAVIILVASTMPTWADLPINTLASFNGTNGSDPVANLTFSGDGNTLYGTTYQGGTQGYGTVFSLPVSGGTPTVLGSFSGTNGRNLAAGLTLSGDGNTLYGTTYNGGASDYGTVFSLPVAGGTPTVLASFDGTNEVHARAGLTLLGDTLYGTTVGGGAGGRGTVFSLPITGGTPTALASFSGGNDGANLQAGLTLSEDGHTLYGTTMAGGTYGAASGGYGTVFSVPITGGTATVLASFNMTNGQWPVADLVLSGNTLYGTTHFGGAYNYGAVFSLPITGGTPTVLASLIRYPVGGLTLSGNTLYGTTSAGGGGDFGTVFSVPITGGTPTVLAYFNGTNGKSPFGDLTLSGNTLYGTTQYGGASNYGTVFSITLPIPEPASLLPLTLATPALLLRRRARKE